MFQTLQLGALSGAKTQSRTVLSDMEYALNLLIGKEEPADLSTIKQACSFCGKQAPDVTLGDGVDAFISNECVDLFTEIFQKQRAYGGSPNGVV